jgi:hypothetical protein
MKLVSISGEREVLGKNAAVKLLLQKGEKMPIEHLTELQYSSERKGPFGLVIYEPGSDLHRGKQWFENVPKYPDEEITTMEAMYRAQKAILEGREVRIVDKSDLLVFHAKGGKVLYPNNPEKFWEEIAA